MRKSAHRDNKSLKTFFLYAGIVLFFILVSLSLKAFLLFQESRFDGENHFILAIIQDDVVSQLALFDPADKSTTRVYLKGEKITLSSLEKTLGIIPDGRMTIPEGVMKASLADTMRTSMFQSHGVKTDLTIFDVLGLSQKAALAHQNDEEIILTQDMGNIEKQIKNLFVDSRVFSENVSVQIINASSTPGATRDLERTLVHLGYTIVAVSPSDTKEPASKIQYFGEENYSLKKLQKLLVFPTEQLDEKAIANIVIILGENHKNQENFN